MKHVSTSENHMKSFAIFDKFSTNDQFHGEAKKKKFLAKFCQVVGQESYREEIILVSVDRRRVNRVNILPKYDNHEFVYGSHDSTL